MITDVLTTLFSKARGSDQIAKFKLEDSDLTEAQQDLLLVLADYVQFNVWGKSGDYAMTQNYAAGLIRPYTIKKTPLVLGPCDGKIGWQASWRHEGLRLLPPARTRQAVRGSLPTIEVANPTKIANAHVEQQLYRAYSL